jgi:hypothetical protein
MRHFTWLAVAAVAIIAVQTGVFTTKSATLSAEPTSVVSMDIMNMQMQAGRNLPIMVIDNPV